MSDSPVNRPDSDAPAAHRWVEPTRSQIKDNVDLYEIVYDEAKRTLDDQSAELNNVRTRAVQYLAFVGSATAFLAGAGIKDATRHLGFYSLASIATVLALAVIILVAVLLNPWSTPLYKRVEPKIIVTTWIEREVPSPTKAEMLRELSLNFDKWQAANNERLGVIRKLYFSAIILGGLQLLAWASLVWVAV
ncbi:hypothetical protein [Jatrophihabitans sp.]|jgi:hypothetical protein|uniref:hypothetical protein n=1 Tax=Jatrophihabitans sp. TaxID=1932789 RepID=UPI002EE9CDF9